MTIRVIRKFDSDGVPYYVLQRLSYRAVIGARRNLDLLEAQNAANGAAMTPFDGGELLRAFNLPELREKAAVLAHEISEALAAPEVDYRPTFWTLTEREKRG